MGDDLYMDAHLLKTEKPDYSINEYVSNSLDGSPLEWAVEEAGGHIIAVFGSKEHAAYFLKWLKG